MTHMYCARGSFHVLRPKHTIKLVTQSAEKWILYGEMGIQNYSRIVSQKREGLRRLDFFTQCVRYHIPWVKRFHQEISLRGEETIYILLENFSIFAKMTIIWPLTPTFGFGQTSIASPILAR